MEDIWTYLSSLYFDQDGVCAICRTLPESGILCVDHVHIKGYKKFHAEKKQWYVRALLCYMCNTSLKAFEKTIDGKRNRQQLEATYEYFKKYPLKGEI